MEEETEGAVRTILRLVLCRVDVVARVQYTALGRVGSATVAFSSQPTRVKQAETQKRCETRFTIALTHAVDNKAETSGKSRRMEETI